MFLRFQKVWGGEHNVQVSEHEERVLCDVDSGEAGKAYVIGNTS